MERAVGDRTTSFDPYEPEQSYDWDYGEPEPRGKPKVLWGRIGALAGALLFAFIIGRASAPGVDPKLEDKVADLTAANQELADENESLEQQLRNLPAQEETTATTPPEEQVSEELTYVVKPGDTLRGIAQKFYCDPELADFLAEANGIEDPTALSVGEELVIPADPGDACG